MANIALINPCFQDKIKSIAQTTIGPPLGLAYLAAVLEKHDHKVIIIDANAERLSQSEIVKRVLAFDTGFIGLTATTPTIHLAAIIASRIKSVKDDISTIIGGVHATMLPKETLEKFRCFDYLVRGEGEYIIAEIIEKIEKKMCLDNIPGLCFRKDGALVINKPAQFIKDLNLLPFPSRHLLPNHLYKSPDSKKFSTIIAMRGCPGSCSYCSTKLLFGKKVRLRSPSKVLEEIDICVKKYGVKQLSFLDDTFTSDKAWVYELCRLMKIRGMHKKISWICLTRADRVDEKLLNEMKSAGCCRVEIGIESGSDKMLDFLNKRISRSQMVHSFKAAKKAGLETMAFVMLGIPGETKKDIKKTKQLIRLCSPDLIQISFCTPYPKTAIYDFCVKNEIFKDKNWQNQIFLKNTNILNCNISDKEYKKIKRNIEIGFYLRPKKMIYLFKKMITSDISIYQAYSNLRNIIIESIR